MRKKLHRAVDNFFIFIATPSRFKYSVMILLALAGIMLLIYVGNVNWETICATFLGIVGAWAVGALIKRMMYVNEDRRKVISDNKPIEEIYDQATYRQTLEIEDKTQDFFFEITYLHDSERRIVINDRPDKKYFLPGRIENNFISLLSAHGGSFIKNTSTVRLDGFRITDQELILDTSRSDFYSHLVTNRAIDYLIDRKVSIRALYEYGPFLSPAQESRLSNHIGVNALVFLNDGAMILKHRGKHSTISKNRLTSSVATRLILDNFKQQIVYSKQTMEAPIRKVMEETLKMPRTIKTEIDFLGFGRDVYEGGKPQFYFAVRADLSSAQYMESHCPCRALRKSNDIDEDKATYVCSRVEISSTDSDRLKIWYLDPRNPDNIKSKILFPERSLHANLFFYYRQRERSLNTE